MTVRVVDLQQPAPALGPAGPGIHLAALATAVREARLPEAALPGGPRPDALAALFEAELRLGLEAGDAARAAEAATALWRRSGDPMRSHLVLTRVLRDVGAAWAAGTCSVRTEHRVTAAAATVVARLRALTPAPTAADAVLLAVPPGERHTLALDSLAHLLEEAGHPVDVLGELPLRELVAAATGAHAVVLSTHDRSADLTGLLRTLRYNAPSALLVVGGASPSHAVGADLVTTDPQRLLALLRAGHNPLTDREREVLGCVAAGMSNSEAAQALGITAGTLKTHLDRLFEKTGVNGRAAVVAHCLRRGWIS